MVIAVSRIAGLSAVVAIGILSLVPVRMRPDVAWPFSLEHAAAYVAAAILLCLGFRRHDAERRAGNADAARMLSITGLLSAYGGALELLQFFVPGRTPSIIDWSANTVGALLGAGLIWVLRKSVPGAIR